MDEYNGTDEDSAEECESFPAECEKIRLKAVETASALGEHCDSVKIFFTMNSPTGNGKTYSFDASSGNLYATIGQVLCWLEAQKKTP